MLSLFSEDMSDEQQTNGEHIKPIYYVTDEAQQAQYISMFKDAGVDAIYCDTLIDGHFISYVEYKNPSKVRFLRIDADINGALRSDVGIAEEEQTSILEAVKAALVNKEIAIKVERFKSGKIPAVINSDEFMRRMSELNGFYGMDAPTAKNETLVLNLTNPIVSSILAQPEEKREIIVNQLYYLAMLSYKKLSPDELSDFVEKNSTLLFDYANK